MDNDILSVIETASSGFSKSQKMIASFITGNYDKAAFMTAAKLGTTVGVSESTVVRFAAELGYEGYPEMRKALQDMIRNRLTSVQRIEAAKGLLENEDILTAVLNSDIEQIRITLEETDRADFQNAVDAIVNADHIYIFGLRSSAAIAGFMGFYFNFLFENVRVVNENSVSEVFEQILRIGDNDVMIALSFPRYSKRTIKSMRYARDRKAKVIGITDNKNSPIAKLADIPLCARSDMVSFVDSLVAPLSLVNALIVAVSAKAKDSDLETDFSRLEAMWSEYDVYEQKDL